MKLVKNRVVWHILGCAAFLIVPLLLAPRPASETQFTLTDPAKRNLLANVFLLAFFYFNYYTLIPKLYFQRKFVIYVLLVLSCFWIICLVPSFLVGHNPFVAAPEISDAVGRPPMNGMQPPTLQRPTNSTLFQEISHIIFLFFAVSFFSLMLQTQRRLFATNKARKDAEIRFLKLQMNPHFFFNSLNSIYALSLKEGANRSSDAILKLSTMMRYVVTESSNRWVLLSDEINYLKDYIAFQKLRLDKRIQLSFLVEGDARDQQIAPLLLIPFIENAFKYGVNPDEESAINIRLQVFDNYLKLIVRNNTVTMSSEYTAESDFGINNTRSRLESLYPKRHSLTLDDDGKTFCVQLFIQFT